MTNNFDMIYFVYGGVYDDFSFTSAKEENYVEFGPFYSRQDAYDSWKKNMWLNVDNALYKLSIDVYDTSRGVDEVV